VLAVVAVIGTLIAGLGLWGALKPSGILALADRFLTQHGLRIAVIIRVALAILLWISAPEAATPGIFRFLAMLAFAAAVLLPLFGQRRLDTLVGWWASRPMWLVRLSCLCVVVFGAFLTWSAAAGNGVPG